MSSKIDHELKQCEKQALRAIAGGRETKTSAQNVKQTQSLHRTPELHPDPRGGEVCMAYTANKGVVRWCSMNCQGFAMFVAQLEQCPLGQRRSG